MSEDTEIILAAGGIVSRPAETGVEVAVIHRPRHDDWSFPKGKVDPGETLEQTALREVREETALRCTLGRPLGARTYPGKEVHYWEMSVASEGTFVAGDEVDAVAWLAPAEAAARLTHEQDRTLLAEFLARR